MFASGAMCGSGVLCARGAMCASGENVASFLSKPGICFMLSPHLASLPPPPPSWTIDSIFSARENHKEKFVCKVSPGGNILQISTAWQISSHTLSYTTKKNP